MKRRYFIPLMLLPLLIGGCKFHKKDPTVEPTPTSSEPAVTPSMSPCISRRLTSINVMKDVTTYNLDEKTDFGDVEIDLIYVNDTYHKKELEKISFVEINDYGLSYYFIINGDISYGMRSRFNEVGTWRLVIYKDNISGSIEIEVIDNVPSPTIEPTPTPSDVHKTELNYTYKDYSNNNIYPLDSAPTLGSAKLLIIPIWFTDSSNYISDPSSVREDIELAYIGSTNATGWHSVKSFYEQESFNKLSFQATVTDWYETGKSYKNYASSSSGMNNTVSLVKEASDWFFTNNPKESRKDYDRDGNGFLDGVMLIYACPDQRHMSGSDVSNLWAYCYWMQNLDYRDYNNPGPNTFFWASYDFMYDSKTALERTGKSSIGSGDCSYCNIDAHTFIHEMGHAFGLEDYYDYGPNGYSPAGNLTMQDYNICGHDPYSVMAYGWADPYIPTDTCRITINDFQSSHDLILLSSGFNKDGSPFDEYFLIELYTSTGLNEFDSKHAYTYGQKGLNGVGIRLWHVDARLTYGNSDVNFSDEQLTTNPHYDAYYGVYHAFSNTYNNSDYGSVLGSKYYDYNILQFIRNDTNSTYRPTSEMTNSDLFLESDSFSMSRYSKQFVKGNTMNNGANLGFTFTVETLSEDSATIYIEKL